MDLLITLCYLVFSLCIIYPPVEFVSAGFTIPQVFESLLGSENVDFIGYHMRRTTLTLIIHSYLPLGYIVCLWCSGQYGFILISASLGTVVFFLLTLIRIYTWWSGDKHKHPVARALVSYATTGGSWREQVSNVNVEFRSVDKVCIQLNATSKLIATETWLIKVCAYTLYIIRHDDAALVATGTDSHELSVSGENEVQYINVDVVPARNDLPNFTVRLTAASLRELQARLAQPVRLPPHLALQQTLLERFVTTFKQHVEDNPIYYVNQALELCIGCMQAQADVKLVRQCHLVPVQPADTGINPQVPSCQPCNCRPLWCCACLARWWASRQVLEPNFWLGGRCTCPVCRASFCLLDVSPVQFMQHHVQ